MEAGTLRLRLDQQIGLSDATDCPTVSSGCSQCLPETAYQNATVATALGTETPDGKSVRQPGVMKALRSRRSLPLAVMMRQTQCISN